MHGLRAAFTFIEIMIVMALIGVMATFVLPRFTQRTPQAEWPTIIDDLNNLVTFARNEAICTHKIYRLTFTHKPGHPCTVVVEEENNDKEHPHKKVYSTVTSYYFNPTYTFHESVILNAFYNGKEKTLVQDEKGSAHCYIIPDGLTQDITLHLSDKNQPDEKGVTLRLEPFAGLFDVQDGFIKP